MDSLKKWLCLDDCDADAFPDILRSDIKNRWVFCEFGLTVRQSASAGISTIVAQI